VQAAGRRHVRSHVPPAPSDVATICYTSGTTGVPKGAVLTHANLIANSAGMAEFVTVGVGDRHISYLPLAHIYERVSMLTATHKGCAVGFYRGDVALLLEDIEELQPTLFTSVPRLYNRIYDKVMGAIQQSSPVARKLFEMAYASKRAALRGGDLSGGRFGPMWDRLVFSKVRARLGGKVRLMTTGASPISEEVFDFLRICFGATVIEGYGMTETSCVISMTSHGDATSGHVGGPVVCCEVKLVDIPEMNYTNADKPTPRGEVCVRGPSVFQGYYKDEQQTREVLDDDGWLHTGDVGTWLEGGRLKIIDRKKNIFKLAQGEYIAPEKLENVYVRSPFVAQSFVFGDSLRHQLVAVVVPDPDHLLPWAASRGMAREMDVLCKNKAVKAAVLASMLAEGKAAKLRSFEQVAAVHLTPDLFSVENGMMTPTFKLKRPQASAAFKADIAAMYQQLESAAK
jgi:long-chain acyl-CoA synthetase